MTISGGITKQLDIFCRVTGFTGDFLSFIVVELIRFFHGAIHLSFGASDSSLMHVRLTNVCIIIIIIIIVSECF